MNTEIRGNDNISGNKNKLKHYQTNNHFYIDEKSRHLLQTHSIYHFERIKLAHNTKNVIYRQGGDWDEINAVSFRLEDGNLFFFGENEQLIALYAANTWTHFVSGDIIVHPK